MTTQSSSCQSISSCFLHPFSLSASLFFSFVLSVLQVHKLVMGLCWSRVITSIYISIRFKCNLYDLYDIGPRSKDTVSHSISKTSKRMNLILSFALALFLSVIFQLAVYAVY